MWKRKFRIKRNFFLFADPEIIAGVCRQADFCDEQTISQTWADYYRDTTNARSNLLSGLFDI